MKQWVCPACKKVFYGKAPYKLQLSKNDFKEVYSAYKNVVYVFLCEECGAKREARYQRLRQKEDELNE